MCNKSIIKTDNKWKQFKYRDEVPKRVLENEFSHLTEEEGYVDGFIHYRKRWYHVSEFMTIPSFTVNGWDGYSGDSFFSGVVIKIHSDGESYKIGTYLS